MLGKPHILSHFPGTHVRSSICVYIFQENAKLSAAQLKVDAANKVLYFVSAVFFSAFREHDRTLRIWIFCCFIQNGGKPTWYNSQIKLEIKYFIHLTLTFHSDTSTIKKLELKHAICCGTVQLRCYKRGMII